MTISLGSDASHAASPNVVAFPQRRITSEPPPTQAQGSSRPTFVPSLFAAIIMTPFIGWAAILLSASIGLIWMQNYVFCK